MWSNQISSIQYTNKEFLAKMAEVWRPMGHRHFRYIMTSFCASGSVVFWMRTEIVVFMIIRIRVFSFSCRTSQWQFLYAQNCLLKMNNSSSAFIQSQKIFLLRYMPLK